MKIQHLAELGFAGCFWLEGKMKLNDMIFVIENRKGTVEANFLLTLDDTIEMLKQSGEYSMKETAAIFSELGRTMTERLGRGISGR